MKVYISTDLEGATGVFKFKQTREKGSPEFCEAMRLLMGDVAAVAEGLREAGVDEVYAMDGHDGGNNFIPECMVSGVRYITGWPRTGPSCGLDESFAGLILLGFHAMNGTPDGILHHTQSSMAEAKYWYDGVERGELYQSGVIGGAHNVPVMMVTGDEACCREAKATFGDDLTTVAVKKGLSREAGILLAAEETREMLREGARQAVASLPKLEPFKIKLPVNVRMRRIGPNPDDLGNPYVREWQAEVHDPLQIISGVVQQAK